MKIVMLIIGIILVLVSLASMFQYITAYDALSEYGKGFVWGNSIIFFIGAILIYLGLKKRKSPEQG